MESIFGGMAKSKDKADDRKMKSLDHQREKKKLAIQQKVAEQKTAIEASKDNTMDDFIIADNIPQPKPKRGEGDFTANLLFPPFVPFEIRNDIWKMVVVSARPITLEEESEVIEKTIDLHLDNCPHSAGNKWSCQKYFQLDGQELFHITETAENGKKRLICIDPRTQERTTIKVADTVLNHRLICREANHEVSTTFWLQNKFAFNDVDDAHGKLNALTKHLKDLQSAQLEYSIKKGLGSYAELVREIRHVSICFTPRKAGLYAELAKNFLSGLRSLDIILYHNYTHLVFDKTLNPAAGDGANPLYKARHIDTMAKAFSRSTGYCKDISKVYVIGTDLVRRLTPNEDEAFYVKVDINDVDAMGPVLRANILTVKEPWLSGEELKEAEATRKKRMAAQKKAAEEQKKEKKKAAAAKGVETKRINRENVQRGQANLQWQTLGRGFQGFNRATFETDPAFIGPINVPRHDISYTDWLAGNGNTPAENRTQPYHRGNGELGWSRFRQENEFSGHGPPAPGPREHTQVHRPPSEQPQPPQGTVGVYQVSAPHAQYMPNPVQPQGFNVQQNNISGVDPQGPGPAGSANNFVGHPTGERLSRRLGIINAAAPEPRPAPDAGDQRVFRNAANSQPAGRGLAGRPSNPGPSPAPAAQRISRAPVNSQPPPAGQGNNVLPSNAPPGYGPYQGQDDAKNHNNNSDGFNHRG